MSKNEKTKAEEIEEGARNVTVVLAAMKAENEEGEPEGPSALDRINAAVQETVRHLRDESIALEAERKGTVVITIPIAVFKSKATVGCDIEKKLPKPPKAKPVGLYVTKGGNLSTEQPKQKRLPGLHAVEGGAADNDTPNTNTNPNPNRKSV